MTPPGSRLPAGLLVSVRSVEEAIAAVAGGAAIVDVKDPDEGPLGRANAAVAAAIGAAVARGSAWTLACGELADGGETIAAHVDRVVQCNGGNGDLPLAIKAGPAGLDEVEWLRAFRQLATLLPQPIELVAVAYADWRAASCPEPGRLIRAAGEAGARAVLIDTFDKSGAGLLDVAGLETVVGWDTAGRRAGLAMAFAGRLSLGDLARLGPLVSATLGVRSAACEGGRMGRVEQGKVAELVGTLAEARGVPRRHQEIMRP
jgi:uncharacterized protein (UPF0264 family)